MTSTLAWIIAGTVLTLLVCFGFGRWLLSVLGLYQSTGERRTMALFAGTVLLSGLVFALSIVNLLAPPAFPALAVLAGAAWWASYRNDEAIPITSSPSPRWALLLVPAFIAYAALYFLHGAAPDHSFDSIYYHLGFVNHYLRDHGFSMFRDNIYEALSQGGELLFTYAAGIGGLSSATLLHVAFAFLWGAAIYFLLVRRTNAVGALSAALLVIASPVVGRAAVTGYIDCIAAAFCIATVWAMELWIEERNDKWLAVAGLLGGFCYAVKYTSFVALLYALLVLLWAHRSDFRKLHWRPVIRNLTWLTGFAAISVLPWILRNQFWYGNPLAPFFNRLFSNPYFFVVEEQIYRRNLTTYGWLESYSQIPHELFFDGRHLQGVIGFGFLLFPLIFLGLRDSFGRRMLLALALFVAVYPSNVGVRFLFPALAMGAVLIAWSLRSLAPLLVVAALLHAYAAWPSVLRRYIPENSWILGRSPKWRVVTRQTPEREFLRARSPEFAMAELMNEANPSSGIVHGFAPFAEAHSPHHLCLEFASAKCKLIGHLIYTAVYSDLYPTIVESRKFRRTETSAIRLKLNSDDESQVWMIHEVRFYFQGHELKRKPAWRLSASAMPSLTPYAFDGSPATAWSPWDFANNGTFLEADFGAAHQVDEVRIWIAPAYRFADVQVLAAQPKGRWASLQHELSVDAATWPNMPREAALAAYRRGVRYLMAPTDHPMTMSLLRAMPAMGLKVRAASREAILFEIVGPANPISATSENSPDTLLPP